MYGHNLAAYEKRISAFGWNTITIDGHSFVEVLSAYREALSSDGRPTMIIARTIKGKGVYFIEDKNGYHGKALDREDLEKALSQLGHVYKSARGEMARPENLRPARGQSQKPPKSNIPRMNPLPPELLTATH
jgi:transketolase